MALFRFDKKFGNIYYIINKNDEKMTMGSDKFGEVFFTKENRPGNEQLFEIRDLGNYLVQIFSHLNSKKLEMVEGDICEWGLGPRSNFALWYLQEDW